MPFDTAATTARIQDCRLGLPRSRSHASPRLANDSFEVSSMSTPRLPLASPPLLLSRSGFAQFNFTLRLVTVAVLVLAFFNISTTVCTHTRKFWSKKEDLGGSQNGKTSKSCNTLAQQLRVGSDNTRPVPHTLYSTPEASCQDRWPFVLTTPGHLQDAAEERVDCHTHCQTRENVYIVVRHDVSFPFVRMAFFRRFLL
ncbi:hypothetical protein EDB85DRAFT_1971141, partial [Lactarius pseudohatsudake]